MKRQKSYRNESQIKYFKWIIDDGKELFILQNLIKCFQVYQPRTVRVVIYELSKYDKWKMKTFWLDRKISSIFPKQK